MRTKEAITIGIILIFFLIGLYLYDQTPEMIASHWNAQGQVDGYIPKFWGLFLMPFISLILLLLFVLIPKIDPLKSNIEKFRKYYDNFVLLVIGFLFYLQLLAIFWSMGIRFDIVKLLAPAFAIVFYYCGILLEKSKRNWFIGIRTPWTLSDEKVWEKTNKLGGKLFKIVGIISLFGIFFKEYVIFLILIPAVGIVSYTVVYSYFEYKKRRR